MDLVGVAAFGRPIVQPSVANKDTVAVRTAPDPREAPIAATPMAARNSPDLRVGSGPRSSSSTDDTRDEGTDESPTVHGRPGASARRHTNTDEDERGSSIDLSV